MVTGQGGKNDPPGRMLTKNEFTKMNGFRIRMHIYPNGNDTRDINGVYLTFFFDDKTSVKYKYNSDGNSPDNGMFVVRQDVTTYEMSFPGSAVLGQQ